MIGRTFMQVNIDMVEATVAEIPPLVFLAEGALGTAIYTMTENSRLRLNRYSELTDYLLRLISS